MFRASIDKKPDLTVAHYNLGLALAQSGQPQQVVYAFQRVIRLEPKFALAYSNLGAAWLQLGNLPQAVSNLQKAIELSPNLGKTPLSQRERGWG